MLRYEPLQFELGTKKLMLLPRLVPSQLAILANRLSATGFKVARDCGLVARRPGQTVRVSAAGFCWSNQDLSDVIVPAIPGLLATPKQSVRADVLMRSYFRIAQGSSGVVVHFSPRVEIGSSWIRLREGGLCALAPDEHAVAKVVLGAGSGKCRMLTDFPLEGSRVKILGRKRYYDSFLPASEAAATLGVAGSRGDRNSYLARDGTVSLVSPGRTSRRKWIDALRNLGEWCYFDPL